MAWIATAVIGGAVIGAGAQIYAADQAADAQIEASQMGIDAQQRMYNQTRSDLTPYRVAGQEALEELEGRLPFLTSPIETNADILLNDPNTFAGKAYDFTRTQGLKAVQNSAAARGLGVSGAALKGAANFATGLADNTYQSLTRLNFDMENVNRTNAYNRLKSLVDTGQSAAAQTGAAGSKATDSIAGMYVGQGNAQAASYNAIGGAVNNAIGNIGGYVAYKGLYGGNPGVNNAPAWGAFNSGSPIY